MKYHEMKMKQLKEALAKSERRMNRLCKKIRTTEIEVMISNTAAEQMNILEWIEMRGRKPRKKIV